MELLINYFYIPFTGVCEIVEEHDDYNQELPFLELSSEPVNQ